MPKLTLAVRVAAGSILLLSVGHIIFWARLAFAAHSDFPASFPYNYLFPILCVFSAAGLFGMVVGAGIFYSRNWARIAALVLAALVAFFCAFSLLAIVVMSLGLLSTGLGIEIPQKGDLARVGLVYFLFFALALWWIILFSRKSVAAQFTPAAASIPSRLAKKISCPPPIALLAWLMIISSALSAISWSLILGKIPAMLFTHIFSPQPSKLIWMANILSFALCGIGLLKRRRWSYDGTIAVHVFWLVSLFVSQLSSSSETYPRTCIGALDLAETYPALNRIDFPRWVSTTTTAIPTALLIAGLIYYRRDFLNVVQHSRHPSS